MKSLETVVNEELTTSQATAKIKKKAKEFDKFIDELCDSDEGNFYPEWVIAKFFTELVKINDGYEDILQYAVDKI